MYIAIIKKAELSWNFLSVKNSLNMMNNLLLTEREGHTGEKLARGRGSTDRAQRAPLKKRPRANIHQYGTSKLG